MSESQKHMAKRIVEILEKRGYANIQHMTDGATVESIHRDNWIWGRLVQSLCECRTENSQQGVL